MQTNLISRRFFTGQNGHPSCTPHNPFSLPKSSASASVARKLDLSLVHDSSVESRGNKSSFDTCEHLQDNSISVIEQSPVKDVCDEQVENTSASDEVTIIEPLSSSVTVEDVKSSDDETGREEGDKMNTPSQLEKANVSTIGEGQNGIHEEDNESVRKQETSIIKRLGHRDLREFAFKKKSERDQKQPRNNRSLSLPSSDNSSASNRKIKSSDFLCPLERKKCKISETGNGSEDTTIQMNSIQVEKNDTDGGPTTDKLITKNVSPSLKVI